MVQRIALLGLSMAMVSGAISAGPVNGPIGRYFKVPASKADGEPGTLELSVECRGNQKTSILIKGDHNPVTDLEMFVYEGSNADSEEKLVAQDKGTKDLIGAVWTPARTGAYRVVIRNPAPYTKQNPYNLCYIAIK